MKIDLGRLSQLDRGIVGAAAVVFVSGFLPWWGYKGPLSIYGGSVSGFSTGFTGWAGILLLFAAGVYLFLRRMEVSLPALPVGPAVAVVGVAALGLLLVLIRWLTLPSVPAVLKGTIGTKWGIWVAILAGIVEVACAVMELRASGEALPWETAASQPPPSTQSE
jgi:hypothetical protein